MHIGIISDSHDNLANIDSALLYLKQQKIKHLIHAGDACFVPTVEHLLNSFLGKVYLVEGNTDDDTDKLKKLERKYKNFNFYSSCGEVTIANTKIAFTHKPTHTDNLAMSGKFDLVIYGHTHKPWEKVLKINNKVVRIINPGTLAGMFAKATFAVYDTKTKQAQLIIIDQLTKYYALKDKQQQTKRKDY